jgi:hypothetical protein
VSATGSDPAAVTNPASSKSVPSPETKPIRCIRS